MFHDQVNISTILEKLYKGDNASVTNGFKDISFERNPLNAICCPLYTILVVIIFPTFIPHPGLLRNFFLVDKLNGTLH